MLEPILSPANLNAAYRQVGENEGYGGADKMETSELLPYFKHLKDELLEQIRAEKRRPSPICRVETPE